MPTHGTSARRRAVGRTASKPRAFAEALESRTLLATHTWTGATNDNWSTGTNWIGGAPAVGESGDVIVVFNTTDLTTFQNIVGLTIHQLLFNAGSHVALTLNQPLTIASSSTITSAINCASGDQLITGAAGIVLTGPAFSDTVCGISGGSLDLSVGVSGTNGMDKVGDGVLRLSGSVGNTFAGAVTVHTGTLLLAKAAGLAVPSTGILRIIETPSAATSTVRLELDNQINDGAAVSVAGDGRLDLNGFDDQVTQLLLKSRPSNLIPVTTGTGTLTVSSIHLGTDAGTGSGAGSVTLTGRVSFPVQCTVMVQDVAASPDLILNAVLTGPGGLTKTDEGSLRLAGRADNTYTGPTRVNGGRLLLAKNPVVGTANAVPGTLEAGDDNLSANDDAVVLEGPDQIRDTADVKLKALGRLDLNGFDETIHGLTISSISSGDTFVKTGAGTLTLGGDVSLDGTNVNSTATILGNLNLPAQRTFDVPDTVELFLDGRISGTGGLTKTGIGTLRFSGTTANTYAGPTRAFGGTLALGKTGGNAVPGALEIGDGVAPLGDKDTVRLDVSAQIADASAVTVAFPGQLFLNGVDDTISTLQGNGLLVLGAPSTLTVGAGNASSTFDGQIVGVGTLAKANSGTLTLTRSQVDTDLTLQVNLNGGELVIGNTMRIGALSVGLNGKATLAATAIPGGHVLVTQSVSVNIFNGRLDLTNGGLVVDYPAAGPSVLADIRTSITSGFAANAWNGVGINSSTAAAQADKSVGYAENNPTAGGFGKTTFLGQNVDNSSVLARLTFDGDADLDGSVGAGDFNLLASNFGLTSRDWQTGDFTYDRTTGAGDFNLLASRFGSALPAALQAGGGTTAATTRAAEQVLTATLPVQQRPRAAPRR